MSIDIIKQQTKDLIDRLKSTTNNIGLGNSGNEYTVIVETFLYKFLNDKFIYEAKRTLPELADADVYHGKHAGKYQHRRRHALGPMRSTRKCAI